MLVHAVRALSLARLVDTVVVAAPPDDLSGVYALLTAHRVAAAVHVVPGGATRQDSVAYALAALSDDVDVVLVHDAARPLAPTELVDTVAAAVREGRGAVVPGIAVADTVKVVDGVGRVTTTLPRGELRAVQTPQGFHRTLLVRAHDGARRDGRAATDDAGLVERLGEPVYVVPGHEDAFKVTRPIDLLLAEAVLAHRRAETAR